MTTRNRILSLALSLVMVFALFAPMSLVFAEGTLTIVEATDNQGKKAHQAVANLSTGSWYTNDRNQATAVPGVPEKAAVATFKLGQLSDVEAVEIAWYFGHQRSFTFYIEVSEDGEVWEEALASTSSTPQEADKTPERYELDDVFYCQYIRVIGTSTTVVATGAANNYTAFYSIEVFGEADPDAEKAPADTSALEAILAAYDPSKYNAADVVVMNGYVTTAQGLLGATYEQQADIDALVALMQAELDTLVPIGALYPIAAKQVEGALHSNSIYWPAACIPTLRDQTQEVWWSASAVGSASVAAIFTFPIESYIDTIELDWYKGADRKYEYSIAVSTDMVEWEYVVEPGTLSTGATDVIEVGLEAVYVKVASDNGYCQNANGTPSANQWLALSEMRFVGEEIEGGIEPDADYTDIKAWENVLKDLHAEYYAEESWTDLTTYMAGIDYSKPLSAQAEVDEIAATIKSKVNNMTYANLDEIQIGQAYWSDQPGEPAWTNGAILFTEVGYALSSYKVKGNSSDMPLNTWVRIYAVPTATTGVYEISNIIGEFAAGGGTPVTEDEIVPENEYGAGFAIALHWNLDDADSKWIGGGSQYASQEFGDRNAAAFTAMDLKPGDLVQLNNTIFTEDQFAEEGEDMQAAWLETSGSWKHRYYANENLGAIAATPIYRKSGDANPEAVEGGPQYLAKDEFNEFVSTSTLTRVEAPAGTPGDLDDDGEIGVSDISNLAKYLAGWDIELNPIGADVDGDGEIGVSDISNLAKYLAGWDITLG